MFKFCFFKDLKKIRGFLFFPLFHNALICGNIVCIMMMLHSIRVYTWLDWDWVYILWLWCRSVFQLYIFNVFKYLIWEYFPCYESKNHSFCFSTSYAPCRCYTIHIHNSHRVRKHTHIRSRITHPSISQRFMNERDDDNKFFG